MTMEYVGLLGHLSEAVEIRDETGCTVAESFEVQSHLVALREQEYRDALAASESNVIQFRPRGK
jgi:hypothetical protein